MNAVCEAPNPEAMPQLTKKRKLKPLPPKLIYPPWDEDAYQRSKRGEMMQIPDMEDEIDEVLRLMRRKPSVKEHPDGCIVCGAGDHFEEDCPCFNKIPPGVELDHNYDQVCIGCGRIGEDCCSKGAYAVLRSCGSCRARGHWYWDDKCPKDFVHQPNTVSLSFFKDLLAAENSSLQKDEVVVDYGKDNKNKDDYGNERAGAKVIIDDECDYEWGRRGEKMKIPDMESEKDEVLRLMRRKPAEKEHDNGCTVCGAGNHFEEVCPCFEKMPPGVELGRDYDHVCIGCGTIGEDCCSKGAYAVLWRCCACGAGGHWYWDDNCSKEFVHHPNTVPLSIFKDLLSAKHSSLQSKEEDEVIVDLGKDNKNEDDYGTEEYGPKVAGGNESSNRLKVQEWNESSDRFNVQEWNESSDRLKVWGWKMTQEGDSKKLFSIPKHLPSLKQLRLLQINPNLAIDEAMAQAGLSWSEDVKAVESYKSALEYRGGQCGLGYQG